jgi:Fe-S-cluster formation regulator IscX/YfhJ
VRALLTLDSELFRADETWEPPPADGADPQGAARALPRFKRGLVPPERLAVAGVRRFAERLRDLLDCPDPKQLDDLHDIKEDLKQLGQADDRHARVKRKVLESQRQEELGTIRCLGDFVKKGVTDPQPNPQQARLRLRGEGGGGSGSGPWPPPSDR